MNTITQFRHLAWIRFGKHALAFLTTLLPLILRGSGVVTECTEANLRAAVAGGGTVTFACDGTITLTATITNTMDTVLDGSGREVTISGGGLVRVLTVATNVRLDVVNLTIANGLGRRGGGILNVGGVVSLVGVQVCDNIANYEAEVQMAGSAAGGGVFNQGGKLVATNCVFLRNHARQQSGSSTSPSRTRGGAICNESGEFQLQSCSFYGNSVMGAPGPSNIRGTAHEANGGAIANSGTLEAILCNFLTNSARGDLGGDIAGEGGTASGGAICNLGTSRLRACTFQSNSVSGGIGGPGGNGMPSGPIDGGPGGPGGPGNGGALFNAGIATVENCTFTRNFAKGGHGGVGGYPYPYPPGGQAGEVGAGGAACGAICDINALCRLTNCIVSMNSAIEGIGRSSGVDVQAVGGLLSVGAIVINTVITGNVPGGDCSGTFIDGGGNVCSDGSCAFTNPMPPQGGVPVSPPFYLVHNFSGQEESYVDAHPFSALTGAADGTFYGVTSGDAWPGAGAVYKVNSNGTHSSFSVIRAFGNDPGYGPAGALAVSGSVLYGTTVLGGQSNLGTVFRINTDGSGYALLHSFGSTGDGHRPGAGVVFSDSTLFGTTRFGGISNHGTIFKIETNGSGFGILKSFMGGTDGAGPTAELLLSGTTLYGTSLGGGSLGGSTIFKINTDGSGHAVLTQFDEVGGSGAHPSTGLVLNGATLFGTTIPECRGGGAGCGSIFKINTDGSGFAILKQFPSNDAPGRDAGLIYSEGKLYGTTTGDGGLSSYGAVFTIKPDGSDYTVLWRFNGRDGDGPNGNLLRQGTMLYGTTERGGFYGAGTAFGLSLSPPLIISMPQSRTVELGDDVAFTAHAAGLPPLSGQWYFNATVPIAGATGFTLYLAAVQFSQSGAYTFVLTNALEATTSAPVTLDVIAAVERRLVPGIKLTGVAGSVLALECSASLNTEPNWIPLGTVALTSASQYWCDDTSSLPPQRFYRARQAPPAGIIQPLDLHLIPALTLTGNPGGQIRVDGINQVGPTDAWFTLDTVTLTNTTQLYFDVTAPGQPERLYQLIQLP